MLELIQILLSVPTGLLAGRWFGEAAHEGTWYKGLAAVMLFAAYSVFIFTY